MKPDIQEFKVFVGFLLQNSPEDYTPFFLRLQPQNKAPIKGVSWKKSRISAVEAIAWMHRGGNVGIAGMKDDPLVNVDLDGENVNKDALKPTLTVRSRSRTGIHGFYFTKNKGDIPNIPTDDNGEVRCRGQYVVCAGSYVTTDPETVPAAYRATAGYYTVEDKQPPAWITFDDLPSFFRKQFEKRYQAKAPKPRKWNPKIAKGHHSALFDISAEDVVLREVGAKSPSDRWGSIFHDSKTAANMSIKDGLLHCWRHNVSHNGLQSLTVLSGYMTCLEAGSPHKKQGHSKIIGDNGAIFHAWLYAKKHGYIPEDDPIPLHAMHYIAEKHGLCKPQRGEMLPASIYDQVLRIVKEEY